MDVWTYLSVLFLSSCTVVVASPPASLQFVNLLFRHGARSPIYIYPTSKNTVDMWPQKSLGWLTPYGETLHYRLGKFIRNRYDGFLNRTYIHHEIKIWSSDMYRTYMSAYSNLDGLYDPPTGEEQWRKGVQWQPIPVMSIGLKDEDNMIRMSKPCPRAVELKEENFRTTYADKLNKENKELFKLLENTTGYSNLNLETFWPITDQFQCEEAQNFTISQWCNATMREKLEELKNIEFTLLFKGKQLQKLKGGPLLKRWIETFKEKKDGNVTDKFHMYSGHDTTVAAVLTSLGVYDERQPYFASAIFLELHKDPQGKYAVKLLYKKDTSDNEPMDLTKNVTGCEPTGLCSLDKFIAGTKDGVPENWEKECGSLPNPTTPSPQNPCGANSADSHVINSWAGTVLIAQIILQTVCTVFTKV